MNTKGIKENKNDQYSIINEKDTYHTFQQKYR